MGKAIIGKKAGDVATYTSPNGKAFEVKVISAKPYTG
jgi:transcription elongation factor GreA